MSGPGFKENVRTGGGDDTPAEIGESERRQPQKRGLLRKEEKKKRREGKEYICSG